MEAERSSETMVSYRNTASQRGRRRLEPFSFIEIQSTTAVCTGNTVNQ